VASVARIIDMLRRKQIELAASHLSVPQGKQAFDYGVACGTFQAYGRMLADIEGMLEEDRESDKKREARL
jgi:hypothetical protein